ncbi:beta-1 adrenergic receptor-like [Liolophura sinensis]|uniref:beta-1 adrenergic receptor-like n=1 Tax=Liolophura sinensis TaxID=3198878 RepID=UPI00315912CC
MENSTITDSGADFVQDNRSELEKVTKTVLINTIVLCIVLSNVINLIVLRKTTQIPPNARICLVNLSIADLCVGLVSCGPSVYPAYSGVWPYGDALCQITGIFHGSSVTISIWSLSLVSVDRYFAILQPLRYHAIMTPRRIYAVLATFWAIALTTFLVPVLIKRPTFVYYRYTVEENLCGMFWEFREFAVLTAVYIPIASGSVLIFTNYKILRAVFQLRKVSPAEAPAQHKSKEGAKKDFKAVKVLIITSAVYFSAWGPYVLQVLAEAAKPNLYIWPVFQFATVWLANSNSFMNVIIYSLMYKSFRQQAFMVIKGVLLCRCGDLDRINDTKVETFVT